MRHEVTPYPAPAGRYAGTTLQVVPANHPPIRKRIAGQAPPAVPLRVGERCARPRWTVSSGTRSCRRVQFNYSPQNSSADQAFAEGAFVPNRLERRTHLRADRRAGHTANRLEVQTLWCLRTGYSRQPAIWADEVVGSTHRNT